MRHAKPSLVSLVFLTLLACTVSKSTPGGSSAQADSDCSSTLQVCVGDTIRVIGSQPSKDETITEIVPAGELSRAERRRVASAGPEVGPIWERDFRTAARIKGLRLLTPGISEDLPEEHFGADFEVIYRLKGCAGAGGPCVGQDQMSWIQTSWMEGDVYHQKIIGIVLDDSLDKPFLIESNTENESPLLRQGKLGEAIVAQGCVHLSITSQPLCVGDTYFYDQVEDSTTEIGMTEQTITFLTADRTKPAVVFQGSGAASKRFDSTLSSSFKLYSVKGCVPGSSTLCLPQFAGAHMIDRWGVDDFRWTDMQLVGFMLHDMMDSRRFPVLVRDQDNGVHGISIDEARRLFVAQGCTIDKKRLRGQKI